jgi:exodeoxyribonuclease V alpha subunit
MVTVPAAVSSRPAPHVLEAVLERLTYVNEETGYTVARVATGRGSDLLTVVGALLGAQPGESLRLQGWWSSHAQYGRQFEVVSYTTVLPATIQGIRRYLGSGLIKGIGPVFAERIVEHFGLDTLQIIEDEPGRLVEVPGLGPKRTAKITAAWQEQKAIKEVMVFLQGVGVSTDRGTDLQEVRRHLDRRRPPGAVPAGRRRVGHRVQDRRHDRPAVGIPHDNPERVKARLQYTLSQVTENGHATCPPRLRSPFGTFDCCNGGCALAD